MNRFSYLSTRWLFGPLAAGAFLFLTAFQQTDGGNEIPLYVWAIIIIIVIALIVWAINRAGSRTESPPTSMEASRETDVPPVDTPVAMYEAPEARYDVMAPPAGAPDVDKDDLVIIEGIGPKVAGILSAAGIVTFRQLADTDVNRLQELLEQANLPMIDPSSWPEQARLAGTGDQAGLQEYQDRLKGGRAT